jgi:arylsulfatase A-like enzyme
LLTGLLPSTTGVYGNYERMRKQAPNAVTLMQYLREHGGYSPRGGGKIFHGTNAYDPASWDYYHKPAKGTTLKAIKKDPPLPKTAWAPWGPLRGEDAGMFDARTTDWAISELRKAQDAPFFLACGFTKPHLPWRVPKKYFDLHPLDEIVLPETLDNDRDDLPYWGKKFAAEVHDVSNARNFAGNREDHAMVLKHDQWRHAVQAYLATISFVDAQIGRLLNALDSSTYADNTIVVLWGDHGWHLGEKQHWRKHALWEVTTRTTLIFAGSARIKTGEVCHRPVSLIDVYPTLLDLLDLPPRNDLDGRSIAPLLSAPEQQWTHPVQMVYGQQNFALRTARWRYIRYADGGEELYDHSSDPNEWRNLATYPQHQLVINQLKTHFPSANTQ